MPVGDRMTLRQDLYSELSWEALTGYADPRLIDDLAIMPKGFYNAFLFAIMEKMGNINGSRISQNDQFTGTWLQDKGEMNHDALNRSSIRGRMHMIIRRYADAWNYDDWIKEERWPDIHLDVFMDTTDDYYRDSDLKAVIGEEMFDLIFNSQFDDHPMWELERAEVWRALGHMHYMMRYRWMYLNSAGGIQTADMLTVPDNAMVVTHSGSGWFDGSFSNLGMKYWCTRDGSNPNYDPQDPNDLAEMKDNHIYELVHADEENDFYAIKWIEHTPQDVGVFWDREDPNYWYEEEGEEPEWKRFNWYDSASYPQASGHSFQRIDDEYDLNNNLGEAYDEGISYRLINSRIEGNPPDDESGEPNDETILSNIASLEREYYLQVNNGDAPNVYTEFLRGARWVQDYDLYSELESGDPPEQGDWLLKNEYKGQAFGGDIRPVFCERMMDITAAFKDFNANAILGNMKFGVWIRSNKILTIDDRADIASDGSVTKTFNRTTTAFYPDYPKVDGDTEEDIYDQNPVFIQTLDERGSTLLNYTPSSSFADNWGTFDNFPVTKMTAPTPPTGLQNLLISVRVEHDIICEFQASMGRIDTQGDGVIFYDLLLPDMNFYIGEA